MQLYPSHRGCVGVSRCARTGRCYSPSAAPASVDATALPTGVISTSRIHQDIAIASASRVIAKGARGYLPPVWGLPDKACRSSSGATRTQCYIFAKAEPRCAWLRCSATSYFHLRPAVGTAIWPPPRFPCGFPEKPNLPSPFPCGGGLSPDGCRRASGAIITCVSSL